MCLPLRHRELSLGSDLRAPRQHGILWQGGPEQGARDQVHLSQPDGPKQSHQLVP